MSYDFLTESFPETVIVDGKEVRVRTSYRCILEILSFFKDELFTEVEKLSISLVIFYIDLPENKEMAMKEMMRFIRCYTDEKQNNEENREDPFDFEIDSSSIYSAFFQIYGIDLSEIDLHWFQFLSMFENLNDGTPNLVNIMNIRQMKIDASLPNDKKAELRRLKRKYSLSAEKDTFHKSNELAGLLSSGLK